MKLINEKNAVNFIFVNTILWGSSYVWIKILVTTVPRFSGLLLCNLIGAAVFLILFGKSLKGFEWKNVGIYSSIVIFSILSNICNAVGLQLTSSSNVAFITQMSVIIVPVIIAVMNRKRLEIHLMISAAAALLGLVLLTLDFSSFTLGIGDLYSFGAALTFSIYLIRLNLNSEKIDSIKMTFVYFAMNILTYSILALIFREKGFADAPFTEPVFVIILILNVAVNILTVVFQNEASRFVLPERAVVIYCFEPVVTLIVAFLFMHEIPDLKSVIGSILIISSILYLGFSMKSAADRSKNRNY